MANSVPYKNFSADLSDENRLFHSFILVWFFQKEGRLRRFSLTGFYLIIYLFIYYFATHDELQAE